jgi:orotidine-5'-phosphate decarboxylase
MRSAKDYIIFPLDVPTDAEAGRFIGMLADAVGMFKVGLELFIRSGPEIVRRIRASSPASVFLDLKLHDIPETVSRAMAAIAALDVRFATVHCGETPRMMEAAVAASAGRVGVLAVTVLTSVSAAELAAAGCAGAHAGDLSSVVLKRAETARRAGCAGVVCSGLEVRMIREAFGPGFVAVTPGIRPLWSVKPGDDQRRVTTPCSAIAAGADYLVIGRPIRDAADPRGAALRTAEEIAACLEPAEPGG